MTKKKLVLFIIICFSLVTTACVRPVIKPDVELIPGIESKPSNGIKIVPTEANSASEFLKFAVSFSDLSAASQKQALTSTNQILLANPNDLLHRMKLVMIYGLPSSSLQDSSKAQNLLQQILQENILLDSQQAFAHVLFDYIIAINKFNKSTHHDNKLLEQLQLKLNATQQKLDAVQQKVNELKNIEKSMGEREAAPKNEIAPRR